MIRRLGIGCVLVAVLAMPAVAAATPSPGEVKNAAKHCKALRAQMGVDAFRAEFGKNKNGRNAFGRCVSKFARADHRAAQNALHACKAEYLADPAAFLEKYGETPVGTTSGLDRPAKPEGGAPDQLDEAARAAIKKCVRLKQQALRADRREALENAAKSCKEERGDTEASREAFREKYATNENGRNAFGKCVSRGVRKAPAEPTPDPPVTN